MPAIATLVNPAVPEEKSIQLFYNTKAGQLGLSLRMGDRSKGEQVLFAADNDDHQGNILNPSELAAATYRGINLVVGVTRPRLDANSEQTVNNISIVSPVYQQLNTTAMANLKVDLASSGDSAWVYYLNGTNAQETTLKEYDLETGSTSTYLQSQAVLPNSSLGSYYDPQADGGAGKRYVVYQEGIEGHLMEFSVNDKQGWNIANTNDAKESTTIGLSFFDNKVYLYYTDSKDNLRRIVKVDGKWQKPDYIEGSPKANATTQVSVSTANRLNHVFYVSREDKPGSFTHLKDKVL
ncbi:hypothetical protein RB595_002089 [Gaeumannomyces hyphopodioides]